MNRDALDKICERGILGLILAILVFAPLATGAVRTEDFLIVKALTLAVMVLWGTRLWLNPKPRLLWPPICWTAVAFSVYAVARYLTSDIEYLARQEMIHVLIYAFLFLAIVNNLYRQDAAHIIVYVIVCLAMAISFYAIYQFVTHSNKVWTFISPYPHRGSGTFISPNNLGGFLEMILPLGLAVTLVSRAKPLAKVFVGYASLVMIAGIGVSVSRGAWFASAIALVVFFFILAFHRTYRLPALVLLTLVLVAGALIAPRSVMFQVRLRQMFSDKGVDDDARYSLWKPAVQVWHENVWFGAGPDHFNYKFRKYRPEIVQGTPDRVHNDYLNTLCDWGIVGCAIVAAALILLFAGIIRTWPHVGGGEPADIGARRSNKFAVVLGASTGLLAILLHSVVDFNMHIPANAILAITLMALLTGYVRFGTDDYWLTARAVNRGALTLLLLAGIGYLGWQTVRQTRETLWLRRAYAAEKSSDAQIIALERAFAIEPKNFATATALGEAYRLRSLAAGDDYAAPAKQAIAWFDVGEKLNPYEEFNLIGRGACLDELKQHDDAFQAFDHAVRADPNSSFPTAYMGWHYVQTGDYAAARVWFERSLRLEWVENTMAKSYLQICEDRLKENASNPSPLDLATP